MRACGCRALLPLPPSNFSFPKGIALIELATGHYPLPVVNPPPPLVPIRETPSDTPVLKRKSSKNMAVFDFVAQIVSGETPRIYTAQGFSGAFAAFVDQWWVLLLLFFFLSLFLTFAFHIHTV